MVRLVYPDKSITFSDGLLSAFCPIDTTDKVIAEIINMTNAGAVCEKIDKKYVDVKEEEG